MRPNNNMPDIEDINDEEIRPIGRVANTISDIQQQSTDKKRSIWIVAILVAVASTALLVFRIGFFRNTPQHTEVAIEIIPDSEVSSMPILETFDTINDVPLRMLCVDNLVPTLQIGSIDTNDLSIRIVLQAADLRADNGDIVGDFVVAGRRISRGQSKRGFCDIRDNMLILGDRDCADCEAQALESKGYFFRQYLLVQDGEPVMNKPKGKHLRRALCITEEGRTLLVFSQDNESFNDFAQALADIPVQQAIYLVGGSAYGFVRDTNGDINHFGNAQQIYDQPNVNYLVFR